VVDDNEQNRAFVKDILSPLGFEIMEAVNGHEALDTMKVFHPNVILMDLVMPGMDGFEAIRRIRRIPEFKEVVVIGISASAYDMTKQESFAAGCNDFLTKPFQIGEILDCLRVHLGLEWICEGTSEMNSESIQAAEIVSLVAPPQEILKELLGFAKSGCITDIRNSIANMKELDPNLIPFADRIEQLTDNFQFDQIIENIRKHMGVRE
jgi:CheY-like chemotaxis protein